MWYQTRMFLPCYRLAESTLMVSGHKKINIGYFSKNKLTKHNKVKLVEKNNKDAISIISCGPATQGVAIVNPTTNQACAECKIGEIWISTDSVAKRYWNKDKESQEIFKVKINADDTKNYLRAGDLAFVLNNEIYVMGRIKDLIIINGTNHYPHDIERSIDGIHPAIRTGNCAAVSIEANDKKNLALVIEVDENKIDNVNDVISKIRQIVMEDHQLSVHLIAFIKPKTLQKTTSGKIKHYPTKLALMENKLALIFIWINEQFDDPEWKEPEPTQSNADLQNFGTDLRMKIRTELQDVLNIYINQIDNQKNFFEFGLDSLMAIELENRLQNYLKDVCHLDNSVIINYPSIDLLSEYIEKLVSNKISTK